MEKVVEEFRYLGMVLNNKCSMEHAADQWAGPLMGGIRGCFKSAERVGARHMPHVMLRLFQTFAHSYGMYASQVWGTALLRKQHVFTSRIQRRHTGFLKFLAKARRSASHYVMLCEMCQRPYQFYWWRCVLRFWNSMVAADKPNPLLDTVLRADVELSSQGGRQKCWTAQLKTACREHGWHDVVGALDRLERVEVGLVMRKWEAWYVESEGRVRRGEAGDGDGVTDNPRHPECESRKICTYNAYFKQQDLGSWKQLPRYLQAGTKLGKEAVCGMLRFRTSNHSLGVETGRWNRTPYLQRTCKRCSEQGHGSHVDDEVHLVFKCVTSADLRAGQFAELFAGVGDGDLRRLTQSKKQLKLARFIQLCVDRVDAGLVPRQ